jgi:peptide/nickel transport system substrate-binding protein
MRNSKLFSAALLLLVLLTISCRKDEPVSSERLIIGISADIKTINPLYSFSVDEGSINDLLFLSLVRVNWNETIGNIETEPLLANEWQWSADSTSVTFFLRNDVYWSDGIKLTAEDVSFSFELYSNPQVQSKFYGTFEKLFLNEDLSIDLKRSIEVIDSFSLKINFIPNTNVKLVDVVLPIVPKHIFDKYEYDEIPSAEINFNPVSCGPYKLKKWDRNQMIILEADPNSFLYSDDMIKELIFKVVPDYNSRTTQLKKGEIDIAEQIKAEDADDLVKSGKLNLVSVKGREFDFIGWNHIDPKRFSETGELIKNPYFSSSNVRRALSLAINSEEIISEYLKNFGQPAITPVSPIFKEYFNNALQPIEYNPAEAREILKSEGWSDSDNNGIIDKNGKEFSFTLYVPGGNPLRQYASTIIKNNLKAVGIEVKIETIELNKLIDNLFNKSMDAWVAAYYIQIPLEYKMIWYSDLDAAPFNFVSYQNKDLDFIIDALGKKISYEKEVELHKQLQEIIYADQPVTFLYWIDNIVAVNNKVKNYEINPLGVIQHVWDWRLK